MSDLKISFLVSLVGVAFGLVLISLGGLTGILTGATLLGAYFGLALLLPLLTGGSYLSLRFA
jgi:hypothetical protein